MIGGDNVNKYSISFKYLDYGSSGRKYVNATSEKEAIKKFKELYKGYAVEITGIKIIKESIEVNDEK